MSSKKCALCWNEKFFRENPEEELDAGTLKPEVVLRTLVLCKKHKEKMEEDMGKEFPKVQSDYVKADIFQDNKVPVVFLDWDYKANEDREVKGQKKSWKESLKFCLRYTYPEWAMDEAGEKRLDKEGNPFRNKNWKPEYPHGYSIAYRFDIGVFESGSLPLWEAFCKVRPTPNSHLLIWKTGKEKDTRWFIEKAGESFDPNSGEKVRDYDVDKSRAEQDETTPF